MLLYSLLISLALVLVWLIAWWRLEVGVALVVVFIPTYLLRTALFGVPTNFFELCVVVLMGIVLLQVEWRQRLISSITSLPKPLSVGIIVFLLAAALSVVVSDETRVSLGIYKSWIVLPLLLAMIVYALPASSSRLIIQALLFSGTISAAFSLTQLGSMLRLQGWYDVPNSLALWLAPLIVLALWLRNSQRGAMVAAMVMTVALLATQAVTALLATILALIVGLGWFKPAGRSYLVVGIVSFVIVSSLWLAYTGRLSYLLQPVTTGQVNSLSVRWQLWSVGLELIREHPLRGIGLGQFEPAYQQELHERFAAYEKARQSGGREATAPLREFVFRDPHNFLLSFWLNTGLLGLLAFVGIHAYLTWRAFKIGRGKLSPETQAIILAVITLLIAGLADTIYWKNDLAVLHWVLLALLAKATSSIRIN